MVARAQNLKYYKVSGFQSDDHTFEDSALPIHLQLFERFHLFPHSDASRDSTNFSMTRIRVWPNRSIIQCYSSHSRKNSSLSLGERFFGADAFVFYTFQLSECTCHFSQVDAFDKISDSSILRHVQVFNTVLNKKTARMKFISVFL